ncbi:hypothetical protein DFR68_103183 [Nocardia mexicana]|uniref:Uncharacterized protein n=1 Tax=Nocardia mexicana TaxID=279262 RepID=A0A370H804_9NOCA|nr:hypothetical protein DFR68_103183 [Nocardia mexicana]
MRTGAAARNFPGRGSKVYLIKRSKVNLSKKAIIRQEGVPT